MLEQRADPIASCVGNVAGVIRPGMIACDSRISLDHEHTRVWVKPFQRECNKTAFPKRGGVLVANVPERKKCGQATGAI